MGHQLVVMGVSGCGKSELGARLAHALEVPFIEGDRFHPAANVTRMAAGIALTDDDRSAWLAALQVELRRATGDGAGVVLACSALKRRYRDTLREAAPQLRFVHLAGPRELIAARMRSRSAHFMPASLLESQLRDLEPLHDDEAGMLLPIEETPEQLVRSVLARL